LSKILKKADLKLRTNKRLVSMKHLTSLKSPQEDSEKENKEKNKDMGCLSKKLMSSTSDKLNHLDLNKMDLLISSNREHLSCKYDSGKPKTILNYLNCSKYEKYIESDSSEIEFECSFERGRN